MPVATGKNPRDVSSLHPKSRQGTAEHEGAVSGRNLCRHQSPQNKLASPPPSPAGTGWRGVQALTLQRLRRCSFSGVCHSPGGGLWPQGALALTFLPFMQNSSV